MDGKPLTPLTHGTVLIVGVKASNFDEEIKTHPRVIIWDSQNEHWHAKELPSNTRAVFMTRFIGHSAFNHIVRDARKRQITIFNPNGTGIIARQVKELLSIDRVQPTTQETITVVNHTTTDTRQIKNKLKPLHQFIDFSKTNHANAEILYKKAVEMGIPTTERSLEQSIGKVRREMHGTAVPKSIQPKVDVSVEILDNLIKELKDMRNFLIETVAENQKLRAKVEKFKKFFDE